MEIFEKIRPLKKELDDLRPIDKEQEDRIMQKFRLDWNYHSNHLEGNSLTYGETKALLLFNITAQGKPLKDHLEITGHNEAIDWVIEVVKEERPLTENFIRQLHTLLLKEPYEVDAITPDGKPTRKKVETGKYKTSPNHVRTNTGEIFRFATPEETPAKMHDLMEWYHSKREANADTDTNPILLAAEFHYKFIRIHPFDDGNGRVARILMNLILMQHGYPPVIIKTEDKLNYFAVLRQADTGMLAPFIEYIAKNLLHSLEIMINGAKGENIEEPEDLDKEIALLEQKIKSAGNKIEITKSKEAILEIYDNTIVRLTDVFTKNCEKFDKFYLETFFYVYMDGKGIRQNKSDSVKSTRDKVENISNIKISYEYNTFNRKGFEDSGHVSAIEIRFLKTKYLVKGSHYSLDFQKYYGEQLNDEETSELIKLEMKAHKEKIENKVEEVKKRKK